ncbi:hypothetical protein [Gloeothece verrucosa]|uniref:Uncharacterized protein n=1 Tax=Gloeothece verrucosa (strain PCC 7822) TaxID=497965 RepID=E0UET1_GLOV7|nr:hypothetical protein [Gloeothece verrucosa]ADN13061.1 hypothetical protein Cyan7822_1052 [Gloeothece verrucosa PCC 7822]
MIHSTKPRFQYVSILNQAGYYKVFISRSVLASGLNLSVGRISNETYLKSLLIAQDLDKYIGDNLVTGKLDKEEIRDIVKKHKKHPHLQLVGSENKQETITVKSLWDCYVNHHKKLFVWSEVYLLTHIQTVTNLIISSFFYYYLKMSSQKIINFGTIPCYCSTERCRNTFDRTVMNS